MKIYRNNTEKIILRLLKESPKSFTELKKTGYEELQSDATLSRNLNRLIEKDLIVKFNPPEKTPHVRFRYELTQNYHDQTEKDVKKSRLQSWISSKMESQLIFNFLNRFLKDEYPLLIYSSDFDNLILDIYSYFKYFNLTLNKIIKNPKYYIYTILYLILYHPDQKYKEFQESIQLNSFDFQDLILEFKSNKAIEEFQFKFSSDKVSKFYLISEDPILHNFKEEIETLFEKFLICWEFPNVQFEENYDFLLHFSQYILDNELNTIRPNKSNLVQFFTDNKICLLIFIREYIWEFLEKLRIDSDLEPPFKLLEFKEKNKIRRKILLSPQILPSSEKRSIENYFYNIKIEKDKRILFLKELITRLAININEYKDTENILEREKFIYLKSHLLLLLKIFQRIDNNLYDKFRKSKEVLTKFNRIKFSYSSFSDEIFNDIVDLEIGLGKKVDYLKRSFTIRFFLERIDHFLNQISLGKVKKSDLVEKIKQIYNIATKNFSKNTQYPFIKKKIEIITHGITIFPDSEISESTKMIIKKHTKSPEIQEDKFPFKIVFPKKQFVFEINDFENWEYIFKRNQNQPLQLIKHLDMLFFQSNNFSNLDRLEALALLMLRCYGIDWALRYLNIYLNYLKWFFMRTDNLNIIEINNSTERSTVIKIIDFIGDIIKLVVHWEYRDRHNAEKYMHQVSNIFNDLIDKNQKLFDKGLLKSYNIKFKDLIKKMR